MIISGLQKVTLLDYPGKVACTIFTYGCDFRCPFCHNPELVSLPQNDISTIDENEIFAFLKKRIGKLDAVVITGGEPLIHKDILRFIKEIHDLGYMVKLDTNGSYPESLEEVLKEGMVSYVAMDIKSSLDGYSGASGVEVELENIKKSISLLKKWTSGDIEFRTTFVKGIHSEKDCHAIGEIVKGSPLFSVQNFRAGKTISSDLGKENQFTVQELQKFKEILLGYVKNVDVKNIY